MAGEVTLSGISNCSAGQTDFYGLWYFKVLEEDLDLKHGYILVIVWYIMRTMI